MGSAAENFDTWFREKLENYVESPGDAAWDNIAESLGHRRKKRVLIFFLRIAAGMLIMLSMGLGYYFYTHQDRVIRPSVADVQQPDQPAVHVPEAMAVEDNDSVVESPTEDFRRADQTAVSSTTESDGHKRASGQEKAGMPVAGSSVSFAALPVIASVPPAILPVGCRLQYKTELPGMLIRPGSNPADKTQEIHQIMQYNLALMEEAEEEQHHDGNWMIGGQVAPLYSYRNLSAANSDNLYSQDIRNLNSTEKGIMAYAGGIAVAFAPSRRLSVQSGLYYSKYGQEKTDIEAIAFNRNQTDDSWVDFSGNVQVRITNSTGIITEKVHGDPLPAKSNTMTQNDLTQYALVYLGETEGLDDFGNATQNLDLTALQQFEYLEIPLTLRYKMVDRKLDFSLIGGFSTHFLAGNSLKIVDSYTTYDRWETDNVSRVNYAGTVGLGLEYPVFANMLISLEPKFRYYLNPLYKSGDLNVFPYSVGVFAGISYVF